MDKFQIQRFLENQDNKAALSLLVNRLKEANSIKHCDTEEEFRAKKEAIQIVEGWIEELFGVKDQELDELAETDFDELTRIIESQ